MELGYKNWTLIFLLAVVVAIVVAVLALVIYDNTMTPNDQSKNLDYINEQLKALILGYNPPA
jgi:hypothetical protein